jgi:hypothetical protein
MLAALVALTFLFVWQWVEGFSPRLAALCVFGSVVSAWRS